MVSYSDVKKKFPKRELNWPKVLFYIHLNVLGLYGLFILFTNTFFLTIVFSKLLKDVFTKKQN